MLMVPALGMLMQEDLSKILSMEKRALKWKPPNHSATGISKTQQASDKHTKQDELRTLQRGLSS